MKSRMKMLWKCITFVMVASMVFQPFQALAHEEPKEIRKTNGEHEVLKSLYQYQKENPEAMQELKDSKTIKQTIRYISKHKENEYLQGLNQKDLRNLHVNSLYLGKIHNQYDVQASIFQKTDDKNKGWGLVVLYDMDRKQLVDILKVNYDGNQATMSNLLTGKTVDVGEENINKNESEKEVSMMWHPPGEQDLWNDPNCGWFAVFYCGILSFLVTPWGSIACSAGLNQLCH